MMMMTGRCLAFLLALPDFETHPASSHVPRPCCICAAQSRALAHGNAPDPARERSHISPSRLIARQSRTFAEFAK